MTLTEQNVLSVYCGKAGKCCCGCAGKHIYNPLFIEEASEDRGYPVKPEEVDGKRLNRIINLINSADPEELEPGGNHIALTVDKTLYIAYLRKSVI